MGIPTYQEFHRSILEFSTNKIQVNPDLTKKLADKFNLSDEDKEKRYEKSKDLIFTQRIWWSVTYLRQALCLDTPERGYVKINQRGEKLLKDNEKTDNDTLKQFPEFIEFLSRTKADPKTSGTSDLTADENIDSSISEINEVVRKEILERILKQDPYKFEQLVVDLLKAMGYAVGNFAEATKKSNDGGIDGILYQDALGLDKVYVQAKRFNFGNKVSSGEIRDFIGSLDTKKTNKGVFFTTSDFQDKAEDQIKGSSKSIILINGRKLTDLMMEYKVGVKIEEEYKKYEIDEDFFRE